METTPYYTHNADSRYVWRQHHSCCVVNRVHMQQRDGDDWYCGLSQSANLDDLGHCAWQSVIKALYEYMSALDCLKRKCRVYLTLWNMFE